MANINYVNPESFAVPYDWKPRGALAGAMAYDREKEYQKIMEHQFLLQKLGLDQAEMDVSEKRRNLPVLEAERQGKLAGYRGSLPYAGRVAESGAQATIAGNEFAASPEARAAKVSEAGETVDLNKFNQFKRLIEQVGPIASQALQISKQNPTLAQQFVQQKYQMAKSRGINLPEMILNPESWPGLHEAMVRTPELERKILEQQGKTEGDLKVENVRGGYRMAEQKLQNQGALDVANANVQGRKDVAGNKTTSYSNDPRINRIAQSIADAPVGTELDPLVKQLELALDRDYDQKNQADAFVRSQSPAKQKEYMERKRAAIEKQIQILVPKYKMSTTAGPKPKLDDIFAPKK